MKQKSRAIYVLFEVKRHTAGGLGKNRRLYVYPAVSGGTRWNQSTFEYKWYNRIEMLYAISR
ncbi:MAG: hypothetical protein SOW08_09350 [Lachnospiraceae bacterium]|nr:hypothetical protein [Lachnospiraceae bacterium]